MIDLVLGSVALLAASGLLALLAGRKAGLAQVLGAGGALSAGLAGFIAAATGLARGSVESWHWGWSSLPGASLSLGLDPLSAFFLIPIFCLSGLAALFGAGYLKPYRRERNLGASWFAFNLLAACMALVCLARNAIPFLFAWEGMSLASFFLVTFEHRREGVRRAGVLYLVAAHIGTACLLVLFLILESNGPTSASPPGGAAFDFQRFNLASSAPAASAVFLLALVGFGTKAGFVPLHGWLPEAHPAAPSHVSALMSGVMIKTGIYGLIRTLTFLGVPAAWWGWTLIAVGAASGVLGVLFALAQHELKRLLAYHSVENVGIIALGIGLGLLGASFGMPAVALLGWGGGLLHVLNHALFKGLLFMGAGAVGLAAGTRELDRLGGLIRKMPVTAAVFLVGSMAISGLPPLNGFVSEFLIYTGAFSALRADSPLPILPASLVLLSLALIGGLAAACFAKVFGTIFLGQPRSDRGPRVREVGISMLLPMGVLAAACGGIGLLGSRLLPLLLPALSQASGLDVEEARILLQGASRLLSRVTLISAFLLLAASLIALLRLLLLSRRPVESTVTWDCGYAHPTGRMQYTASSFAQPILAMFRNLLRPSLEVPQLEDLFPQKAAFASKTPDLFEQRFYRPMLKVAARLFGPLRRMQHGHLQLYVLTLSLVLLALLLWKMG